MKGDDEARRWVAETFSVPRETLERLDRLVQLLRHQNERQNLVSRGTLEQVWSRHIADSAQLLLHAPEPLGAWVDLGSGAGFPGLIVAALRPGPVALVEERKLRVEFLHQAAEVLGVRVEIVAGKAERLGARPFKVISARAFAPLGKLLEIGARFSTRKTVWILPKGRNAQSELEALDSSWQGEFRLEPSLTDPEARIIVATGLYREAKRNGS